MAGSSVTSAFKFISFKVDRFEFQCPQNLLILEHGARLDPDLWNLSVSIRLPVYFKSRKAYVGGLNCELKFMPKSSEHQAALSDKPVLTLGAGIAGLFEVTDKRFEKDVEENLVKYQIPAILFAHARATVTSFLANAGFGSVIVPLVNMREIAEKALASAAIEERD